MRPTLAAGLLVLMLFSACAQRGEVTATPTAGSPAENQAEAAFAEAREKLN